MVVPKARKLPSGNWFIQLRLDGESVPVTATSEKECINMARLIKAEYKAGKRLQKELGITLSQAIEKYIDKRRNVLSPSTIRGYTLIKKHRFADVMDKQLQDISDWQAVCNEQAALCSAKTLKNAWLFVASVLREQGLAVPKVTLPQIVAEDKAFLEPEQIPVFIEALKGKEYEVPALLALHGLRMSEILGLRKTDIDFKSAAIYIRGAVVYNENNELERKKTNKNTTSRRDVPIIIPELESALRSATWPIVTLGSDTLRNRINRLCAENNLPEVGLHGLRHSFASLGYHLGVPEEYIMQIGGWADYSTMRKIYTHLAKKDALKSEKTMRRFFKNANKNANLKKGSDKQAIP